MKTIAPVAFTLLTDGSSDRVLLRLLDLLLDAHLRFDHELVWADLRGLDLDTLAARIGAALRLYPCRVLFIHRDAEGADPAHRVTEIETALGMLDVEKPPHVCVIPVRMTEAWLLSDEAAIRRGAGNSTGAVPLKLPKIPRLEDLPDPKRMLHRLLREASGLRGRRRHRFDPAEASHRVAENIDDIAPLRALPSFKRLERDVRALRDLEETQ